MAECQLPTGTVTFLFTDIEGSTRLWDAHHDAMARAVAGHDAILRNAIEVRGGYVFKTVGDAFCAAFQTGKGALDAAIAIQHALAERHWDEVGTLRVRTALHTGSAEERENDYFGPTVNRIARLLSAGHGGQVLLSAAAVNALGALPVGIELRDLGDRRLKDLTQPERVYQLVIPGLPDAFPPLNSLDARPNNLPMQPTPLLGREGELAETKARLRRPGARLLTLTGPGGTGKTRLALQAAADLIDDFPHGVWFVDLGAVTEPDLVTAEIARALGVREEGDAGIEARLREHLRDKELLLVLDNFEQLLAAAKQVADLVARTSKVKVLVTSRAPLRIAGEEEYPVPPLPLPDPKKLPELAHLEAFPSVELFVARAAAVKPGFALTPDNAPAVTKICVALDGLPLAIELAAARTRVLNPQALLPRLNDRLKVLTGGGRDRAARQQTLRGAIAWSHDLLGAEERVLFRRLAVFAGGCTFEAAEAVANVAGDLDLFEGIGLLAEHSLLRQEETSQGESRFRMLATIREFASEQLETSGEADAVRRSHAADYLALAHTAEGKLTGPEQVAWLETLETEHDNLRAALAWAQAAGEIRYALDLTGALAKFWQVRGHLTEGRRWLEQALAADAKRQPLVRIPALLGAGRLANAQGDYDRATQWLEEAMSLVEFTGDLEQKASILNQLAHIAVDKGRLDHAELLFAESLALCEQAQNKALHAKVLGNLGAVAQFRGDVAEAVERYESQLAISREEQDNEGIALALFNLMRALTPFTRDRQRAREYGHESLRLTRELGDKVSEAYALMGLARLAQANNDLDESIVLHEQSLLLFREVEDRAGVAKVLGSLGLVIADRGDYPRAVGLLCESLLLFAALSDQDAVAEQLEVLACVTVDTNEPSRAARLFGAAEGLRDRIGLPVSDEMLARHEAAVARLGLEGDGEMLRVLWEAGRVLATDEAVAVGLDFVSGDVAFPQTSAA